MEETQNSEVQQTAKSSFNPVILIAVVVVLLVGGGLYFAQAKKSTPQTQKVVEGAKATPTAVMTAAAPSGTASAMSTGQKLADSPDGKFAYKVFPGTLTADAKQALTGFDMQTKTNPDGSTTITLVAKKQGYTTQTLTVKQGQSLYFIEKTLFDDHADTDEDGTLHDDTGIVVDKDGYIVSQ